MSYSLNPIYLHHSGIYLAMNYGSSFVFLHFVPQVPTRASLVPERASGSGVRTGLCLAGRPRQVRESQVQESDSTKDQQTVDIGGIYSKIKENRKDNI